jgi:ABC-type sugar transport system ATPase subunit
MSPPALEGRNLTKAFAGVTVVDGINIVATAGEIRAVIGENGAGKSTLMNLLTGVVHPDAGEIRLRGSRVDLASPRHAAQAGIAIVHQELQLVPLQSVTDNLMLVRPPAARRIRRHSRAERHFVMSLLHRVRLDVEPEADVATLSIAQCQLLEIAKALALDAAVIILDEPTAALLPVEAQALLTLVEGLRDDGRAVLYVSHALDEIQRIADAVSVLRDGRLVAEFPRDRIDRDTLVRAMVDRPVGLYTYALPPVQSGEIVLKAEHVSTHAVRDVNFELRAGEILGFAGLMGCGMHDAALALCGEQSISSGALTIGGTPCRFRSTHDAATAGIVMVPEERKRDGIVPAMSVCENMHLGRYGHHARRGLVKPTKLRDAATDLVRRFQIRLRSIDQPIETLSGGNQQKALIARCVQTHPRVLIIASPTRGVDIGAKQAIHEIILELAAKGTAIVLISPELEELLGLAHRVAVFSQRRMVAILPRDDAAPTRILQLAIGDSSNGEPARAA